MTGVSQNANGRPRALHPCQTCGACCAYFRVNFYWREAEPREHTHTVPAGLFQELNEHLRVMNGTTEKSGNRCVALKGRVGEEVGCTIYANRPTPCRAFRASFEDGTKNVRCDEARAIHGLRPLHSADWPAPAVEASKQKPREVEI